MFVGIEDDGQGFAAGAGHEPGHFGLTTMRERGELGGGWFRLRSTPGAGTAVEFWLPEQHARVP